jgi:hypothetical protein
MADSPCGACSQPTTPSGMRRMSPVDSSRDDLRAIRHRLILRWEAYTLIQYADFVLSMLCIGVLGLL